MVEERAILLRGGTIVPISGRTSSTGEVLVVGSRIAAAGPRETAPGGADVLGAGLHAVRTAIVDCAPIVRTGQLLTGDAAAARCGPRAAADDVAGLLGWS